MHHVPPAQWLNFLQEMRRVTKPGGIVAIYEHNPLNPVTQRIVDTCPLDENAVLLKSGKLVSLMEESELRDARSDFIIFFPFKLGLFRIIEKLIYWLPLGAQYVTYSRV